MPSERDTLKQKLLEVFLSMPLCVHSQEFILAAEEVVEEYMNEHQGLVQKEGRNLDE